MNLNQTNETVDDSNLPSYMRATKSKKNHAKAEEGIKYEQTMRSKSPVKDLFNKKNAFKQEDKEIGRFKLQYPANKKFNENAKFLDNDPNEEYNPDMEYQEEQRVFKETVNQDQKPNLKVSAKKEQCQNKNLLQDDKEILFDKKHEIKGRKEDELLQNKQATNNTNRTEQTLNLNQSQLNRSFLNKTGITNKTYGTEIDKERIKFIKTCRRLRGQSLFEILNKILINKSLSYGFKMIEYNCSEENVNLFKNYGDEFFEQDYSNAVMNKTCVVVKEKIKNKQTINQNQDKIKDLNVNIRNVENEIDKETYKLLKLQTLIDKSDQPLKNQFKVMHFAYQLGNIIANRWAKRSEFNRMVADTYKTEALDTIGSDESKVVQTIRDKLREGYKSEIESNYKNEKMKLHSQVRVAENKEKQNLNNMKKRRDDLESIKEDLANVEDQINEIYNRKNKREVKLLTFKKQVESIQESQKTMQSLEDVENIILANNQTLNKLKNQIADKTQTTNAILNKSYLLKSENKILSNRLFEENKKLTKSKKVINELEHEKVIFDIRSEKEVKNKTNLSKFSKSALIMIKVSEQAKQERKNKYINILKNKQFKYVNMQKNARNVYNILEKTIEVNYHSDKLYTISTLRINNINIKNNISKGSRMNNDLAINVKDKKDLEELKQDLNQCKTDSKSIEILKNTLLSNTSIKEIQQSDQLSDQLSDTQFIKRMESWFEHGDKIVDYEQKLSKIYSVCKTITLNCEIKLELNTHLETTKILKNDLDKLKDDLFNQYQQEEEESDQPEITKDFSKAIEQYENKIDRINQEISVENTREKGLNNLNNEMIRRINEIKKMRDGAEMDLDLEVTQKNIENSIEEIKNLDHANDTVDEAINILETENDILQQELEQYESLSNLNKSLIKEESNLKINIESNEKVKSKLQSIIN